MKEAELFAFFLTPEALARAADEMGGRSRPIEIVEHYGARDVLIRQFSRSFAVECRAGFVGRLYLESLAGVMAVHLLRSYSVHRRAAPVVTGRLPSNRLSRALEYIHEHLADDLSLFEMAEAARLSPFYFARLFKRATGLSPQQYVIKLRIERAKALLTNSGMSITDIAHSLGFGSQSHFSRTFRRHVAVTPAAYRSCSQ